MSEETYQQDQKHAGEPHVAAGGGTAPDPEQSAGTGGVGSTAERTDDPGPAGGAAYDLKSGNLPEPQSDSGT